MKPPELTTYSDEQLKQKIVDEQEELRKIKFAHRVSSIEQPMKIKLIRRSVARLKTALRFRQLQK